MASNNYILYGKAMVDDNTTVTWLEELTVFDLKASFSQKEMLSQHHSITQSQAKQRLSQEATCIA